MNEKDIENFKRNKHISDNEILRDIKDTELEIKEYEIRNKNLYSYSIEKRKEFIEKLKYLLKLRHPE